MTATVLGLSILGTFYPGNRGSVYTALLVLYMLTAFVGGYISAQLYAQLGGDKWATNAGTCSALGASGQRGLILLHQ